MASTAVYRFPSMFPQLLNAISRAIEEIEHPALMVQDPRAGHVPPRVLGAQKRHRARVNLLRSPRRLSQSRYWIVADRCDEALDEYLDKRQQSVKRIDEMLGMTVEEVIERVFQKVFRRVCLLMHRCLRNRDTLPGISCLPLRPL